MALSSLRPMVGLSLLCAASVAVADTASSARSASEWQVSVSPYFWMAGIQGKVGQFNLPAAKVKSDFGQIFNELDFAFMGIVEARRGPYSIFADVAYTKTSIKDSAPQGVSLREIGVSSQAFSGLLGGGYSVLRTDAAVLDVIAGVRVWSVSTKLTFHGGLLDQVSKRDSATWVDVVAGVKGAYFLTDRAYLTGWGNIGAGQADLDWDVVAGLGYQFKDNLSAVLGYRIQGVDYSRHGFRYDMIQKGPIMGLSFTF